MVPLLHGVAVLVLKVHGEEAETTDLGPLTVAPTVMVAAAKALRYLSGLETGTAALAEYQRSVVGWAALCMNALDKGDDALFYSTLARAAALDATTRPLERLLIGHPDHAVATRAVTRTWPGVKGAQPRARRLADEAGLSVIAANLADADDTADADEVVRMHLKARRYADVIAAVDPRDDEASDSRKMMLSMALGLTGAVKRGVAVLKTVSKATVTAGLLAALVGSDKTAIRLLQGRDHPMVLAAVMLRAFQHSRQQVLLDEARSVINAGPEGPSSRVLTAAAAILDGEGVAESAALLHNPPAGDPVVGAVALWLAGVRDEAVRMGVEDGVESGAVGVLAGMTEETAQLAARMACQV
ncbi:hypothetical protein J8273_0288 [Carpediemonas membranifera]|uniref:Uncharacterized protein n=1 Tax=Carpediemonas membranifera TaxID=201153 RepID=A0A8J6B8Q8_9EUKA|nr:hypothetical protein J8273_0288 [Carpediemonas membranifera]|eukprot:KAG9395072.1 hypothetical protein J8273_0288 [Carpediemonas membranifera]